MCVVGNVEFCSFENGYHQISNIIQMENRKKYMSDAKNLCRESDKQYDNIKDMIDMLYTLVPYQRTLCIANNMVVLKDQYMRNNIDMTSFKFGGKIKVMGYITNKIGGVSDNSGVISPLAQISVLLK